MCRQLLPHQAASAPPAEWHSVTCMHGAARMMMMMMMRLPLDAASSSIGKQLAHACACACVCRALANWRTCVCRALANKCMQHQWLVAGACVTRGILSCRMCMLQHPRVACDRCHTLRPASLLVIPSCVQYCVCIYFIGTSNASMRCNLCVCWQREMLDSG
jgi:hypothetical protein